MLQNNWVASAQNIQQSRVLGSSGFDCELVTEVEVCAVKDHTEDGMAAAQ